MIIRFKQIEKHNKCIVINTSRVKGPAIIYLDGVLYYINGQFIKNKIAKIC